MQKCRVKMSKTIERSEQHFARVSPPVVLGHVDSSQVSIGFKRIDYRTVSNARALKRRHRFENSKRRPASTIAKKGHGEKQFAGCHLRQSHGFSFARIKFAWTIERYSFFFSFLFSLSPSKLFQSLRVSSFMPNLLPFVFHDKHDDKINISSSTND